MDGIFRRPPDGTFRRPPTPPQPPSEPTTEAQRHRATEIRPLDPAPSSPNSLARSRGRCKKNGWHQSESAQAHPIRWLAPGAAARKMGGTNRRVPIDNLSKPPIRLLIFSVFWWRSLSRSASGVHYPPEQILAYGSRPDSLGKKLDFRLGNRSLAQTFQLA